jgi:hypothetical protein
VAPSFDIARKQVQKHLFIAILRVRIAGESSAKRGLQHRPSIFQDRLSMEARVQYVYTPGSHIFAVAWTLPAKHVKSIFGKLGLVKIDRFGSILRGV